MKAYFRRKGRYKDGRQRIVIEKKIGRDLKSKVLPRPEKLWFILDRLKSPMNDKGKNGQQQR